MTEGFPRAPGRMTPAFALSGVQRCINECFGRRQFGHQEMIEIVNRLCPTGLECVYCGSPNVARWDHLFAVAQGGDTVIGNMVPACSRCDDSKQHLDYRKWMFGPAPNSPATRQIADIEERCRRLDEYVAAYCYSPTTVELRVNPVELSELNSIRQSAASLRLQLEQLIQRVQKRLTVESEIGCEPSVRAACG